MLHRGHFITPPGLGTWEKFRCTFWRNSGLKHQIPSLPFSPISCFGSWWLRKASGFGDVSHLLLGTVVPAAFEALQEPQPSLPGVPACFSGFCFNFQLSPSTHNQWSSLVRNPRNSAIAFLKMSSQKLSLMLKFLNFLNSLNFKFSKSFFRVFFFFLNPLVHLGFIFMCVHAKSLQSWWVFVILWTIAHQAPLSMRFSRQEYWSRLPCLPWRDLLSPVIKPAPLFSPALAGGFFAHLPPWKPFILTFLCYSWCAFSSKRSWLFGQGWEEASRRPYKVSPGWGRWRKPKPRPPGGAQRGVIKSEDTSQVRGRSRGHSVSNEAWSEEGQQLLGNSPVTPVGSGLWKIQGWRAVSIGKSDAALSWGLYLWKESGKVLRSVILIGTWRMEIFLVFCFVFFCVC